MTTEGALAGVRVLELGGQDGYAVPYASKLLADLGAEVVIVEPPEGHELRRGSDRLGLDPAVSRHMFEFLSGGKKSVIIDLSLGPEESVSARKALRRLVSTADVVLDGLGVGVLASFGIDDESLHEISGDAVVVHVSPWGSDGPYRDRPATGLVLQAAAGWVSTRQEPGLPWVQVGGHMHEWIAGSYVAAAAMTGRAHRAKSGGGGVAVDFSLFECIHSTIPYSRLMADTNAELGLPRSASAHTPFGVRPCKDGWVGINILTGQQWVDACLMTNLVEFIDQQQQLVRGEGDIDGFGRQLIAWLRERTVHEVVELGQALRIPVVPVATGGSLTALSQWTDRDFFRDAGDGHDRWTMPGPPWRLQATPTHGVRPAPRAGEHTELAHPGLEPVGGLR